jgi:hypothetical protein
MPSSLCLHHTLRSTMRPCMTSSHLATREVLGAWGCRVGQPVRCHPQRCQQVPLCQQ